MKFKIIPADTLHALINLCGEYQLDELAIKTADGKFKVSRVHQNVSAHSNAAASSPVQAQSAIAKHLDAEPVLSPLTGVFYRASAPGAEIMIEEGDSVVPGDPLCIVEAMKVMNEITSDIAGTVVKVIPKDGDVVEKDSILFLIKPDKHENA